MRIIYLIMGNGLSSQLGGSIIRSINIMKNLSAKPNVEISVITTSGGKRACLNEGLKAEFLEIPCSIVSRTEKSGFDRFLAYLISTLSFPFFINRIKQYDVLYTDSDFFCDVIPAVYLRTFYPKTKWTAMIHHSMKVSKQNAKEWLRSGMLVTFQLLSFQLIRRFADGVFVYDTDMGRKISNYFTGKRIFRVWNGYDEETIHRINAKRLKNAFSACYLGGIRPSKGMFEIIPIWKRVVRKNCKASLIVVGAGVSENISWFKDEIKKNGLSKNITFIGGKPNAESLSLLSQSKLLFLPSLEEGWGITVCEAAALNRQAVVYNLPAFDKFSWVEKIQLKNHKSFAQKTLKGISSTRINRFDRLVQQYSWRSIANNELKIFKELTNK